MVSLRYDAHFSAIAHLRPTQRQDVVHRVGRVLGHPHRLELREVRVHLGRRFGARRHLEHHLHAIDGDLGARLLDFVAGHDQRHGARGRGLPEAAVHAAACIAGQQGAVHVDGTPPHDVAGDHVLAHRVLGEVLGRDDLDLAGLDIGLIDDATHAAVVIDMGVAVDDGKHWPLAELRGHEVVRCLGRLSRDQRIEHDPAGVTLDEGDVREVEPAHLIDAVRHLEQAVLHVELRVAPQARVHRIGRRLVERDEFLVALQVPDDRTRGILDRERLGRTDEAALARPRSRSCR